MKDKDEIKKENLTEFDFWYVVNTCWHMTGGESLGEGEPTHEELCTWLGENVDWDSEDPYASSRGVDELKDVNQQRLYGTATACYDIYKGQDGDDELS